MVQSPQSILGALLAFAQADLEGLKPDRLRPVRKTIADVVGQASHARSVVRVSRLLHLKRWRLKIEEDLAWADDDAFIRSRTCKRLVRLQTTLNEYLAALFPVGGFGDRPGGTIELPVRDTHLHIQRGNAGSAAPVEVFFVAEEWQDAFWLSTAGLLAQFGSAVRRCPTCATIFVRNRKQEYCSIRCERKKRNAKYYRSLRKSTSTIGKRKR